MKCKSSNNADPNSADSLYIHDAVLFSVSKYSILYLINWAVCYFGSCMDSHRATINFGQKCIAIGGPTNTLSTKMKPV